MRSPLLHILCLQLAAGGVLLAILGLFAFSLPAMTAGAASWVLAIYVWERARGRYRG